VRDLGKAVQEELEGVGEELPADAEVAGATLGGLPAGPEAALLTGGGAALAKFPEIAKAKEKEGKAGRDALSATGKFIGARLNDLSKSIPRPTQPRTGTGK
jgi:hypothetical protein